MPRALRPDQVQRDIAFHPEAVITHLEAVVQNIRGQVTLAVDMVDQGGGLPWQPHQFARVGIGYRQVVDGDAQDIDFGDGSDGDGPSAAPSSAATTTAATALQTGANRRRDGPPNPTLRLSSQADPLFGVHQYES